MWRFTNVTELNEGELLEAARILVEALAHVPSAWSDLPSALEEVNLFLPNPDADHERIALAALEGGQVRGWIGAIRHSAFAWELHPLVVDPPYQRQGWGSRLVVALESVARSAGVVTLWLGTDDDFGGTNLGNLGNACRYARPPVHLL